MTVQNRYKPKVKSRAASTDTTITVDSLPTDTSITSGYMTAKTSKGKFIEEIKFTGTNTAGTTYTLTGCLRGLREYGSDVEVAANKKPLPAGTILVMGPNQNIENNEAKLDIPNTFTGDQTIINGNANFSNGYGLSAESDAIRVWNDGNDLQFKSKAQAQRSFSQLASLSGSNDKLKISAVDTTEGYGAAKLLGGDGISATDSGAGNSTLTFAVDLATNPALEFDSNKLRVKVKTAGGVVRDSDGLSISSDYAAKEETLFVSANSCDDSNPNAAYGTVGNVTYLFFTDAVDGSTTASVRVPNWATGISSIKIPYLNTEPTTNLVFRFFTFRLREGSLVNSDTTDTVSTYGTGSTDNATEKITVPAGAYDGITIQAGDIFSIFIERNGGNASDTYNANWGMLGVEITFS